MAKAIIPEHYTIIEAKALPHNTHKIVAHCLEFYSPDCLMWRIISARANGTCPYPDIILFPLTYAWRNPKDAALNMQALKTSNPKYSYRISRYPVSQQDADVIAAAQVWKDREASRFTDGKDGSPSTYQPLPWANEPWFKDRHEALEHFAHVSLNSDGMIAFTENRDKGANDIQKRMAPGRYLSTYYSDQLNRLPHFETGAVSIYGNKVTVDPISHYARLYTTTYGDTCELKFASTSDHIVEVYQKGPDSCMTFRNNDYAGHMHPCSVYAAGDLNLAYLIQKDGEITARALVWPDKLLVGRTYGDSATLISKLVELGYQPPNGYDDIKGARMLKIQDENNDDDAYIMPFLDCDGCYYHDGGEYWIMGQKPYGSKAKEYRASHTHGLDGEVENDEPAEYEYTCDSCGEGCNDYSTVFVPVRRSAPGGSLEEQTWCDSCTNDCWLENSSGDFMAPNVARVELANGDYQARTNLDDYFQCAFNSDWYHMDDCAGVDEDGDSVSNDAVKKLSLVQENNAWIRPEDATLDLFENEVVWGPAMDHPKAPEVSQAPEFDYSSATYTVERHAPARFDWSVAPWIGTLYRYKVVNWKTGEWLHPRGFDGFQSLEEAIAVCTLANELEAQQVAA